MNTTATLLGVMTEPKHDEQDNWTGAAISASIEIEGPDAEGLIGIHRVGLNIDLSPALIDIVKVEGYKWKFKEFIRKRVVACMKAIDEKYEGTTADTYYIYSQIMGKMPVLIEKAVARVYYSDNLRTGETFESDARI